LDLTRYGRFARDCRVQAGEFSDAGTIKASLLHCVHAKRANCFGTIRKAAQEVIGDRQLLLGAEPVHIAKSVKAYVGGVVIGCRPKLVSLLRSSFEHMTARCWDPLREPVLGGDHGTAQERALLLPRTRETARNQTGRTIQAEAGETAMDAAAAETERHGGSIGCKVCRCNRGRNERGTRRSLRQVAPRQNGPPASDGGTVNPRGRACRSSSPMAVASICSARMPKRSCRPWWGPPLQSRSA
jgi:hypothetical protein